MAKKKVILTRHAQERMTKRGVSRENIAETIDKPTHMSPIAPDKTQEYRKKIGKKECYVVVEHKNNKAIVITAGWS
ncbi:MAG: DUF4258 domain-containing protein [Candidatus Omnitrophota bacterium]